jgi:hypothetical protein
MTPPGKTELTAIEMALLLGGATLGATLVELDEDGLVLRCPGQLTLPESVRLGIVHRGRFSGTVNMLMGVAAVKPTGTETMVALKSFGIHSTEGKACLEEFLRVTLRQEEVDQTCFEPGQGGTYYWFPPRSSKPETKTAAGREHRLNARQRIAFHTELGIHDGRMCNMSAGGLLVASDSAQPRVEQTIRLVVRVALHAAPVSLHLQGEVRWVRTGLGSPNGSTFGVALKGDDSDADFRAWKNYVDREMRFEGSQFQSSEEPDGFGKPGA